MYDAVLVPVDASPCSRRALLEACRVMAATHRHGEACTVYVLCVAATVGVGDLGPVALDPSCDAQAYVAELEADMLARCKVTLDSAVEAACAELQRLAGDASDTMVIEPIVRQPDGATVANVIVDAARENRVDVIVMGTHGRQGITRAIHGSVCEDVIRMSPVPVLGVHSDAC